MVGFLGIRIGAVGRLRGKESSYEPGFWERSQQSQILRRPLVPEKVADFTGHGADDRMRLAEGSGLRFGARSGVDLDSLAIGAGDGRTGNTLGDAGLWQLPQHILGAADQGVLLAEVPRYLAGAFTGIYLNPLPAWKGNKCIGWGVGVDALATGFYHRRRGLRTRRRLRQTLGGIRHQLRLWQGHAHLCRFLSEGSGRRSRGPLVMEFGSGRLVEFLLGCVQRSRLRLDGQGRG